MDEQQSPADLLTVKATLEQHIKEREPILSKCWGKGYGTIARYLLEEAASSKKQMLELGCCQGPKVTAAYRWHGDFVLPILLACKKTGGHLTGVNIEPCPVLEKKIDQLGLRPYWTFVLSDDEPWLQACNQRFDLILVDTNKVYRHVLFELNQSDRLLNDGGVILVHDTLWHVGNVAEAVLSFLARNWGRYSYREIPTGLGLGILRRM